MIPGFMIDRPNIPRITIRWIFLLGALFVVGPLSSRVTAGLTAIDGSQHTSLLVGSNMGAGILATIIVFALCAAIVLPGAAITGPRRGMLLACFCLSWASWTTGSVDEIIRSLRGGSPVQTLVMEAVLVGVLMLLLLLAILRVGKVQDRGPDGLDFAAGKKAVAENLRGLVSLGGLAGLAAAVVMGGLVAWIFAIEPLKGQAVFAALLGGIAAGAGAHMVSITVADEDHPAPTITPFVAIALLAVIGPIAMQAMADGDLRAASFAGKLFPLGHILPLDWAAGGMLGVPIGVTWARSMIEDHKGESKGHKASSAGAMG